MTAWKHLSCLKTINFQNIQIIVKEVNNKSVALKMKFANMISESSISLGKNSQTGGILKSYVQHYLLTSSH